MLEEARDRKVDYYARVLQKAFQKHFNEQKVLRQKEEAADIFFQKKQRREHSLNRNFHKAQWTTFEFGALSLSVIRAVGSFLRLTTRLPMSTKGLY